MKLCLTMIVKNESHILARCLDRIKDQLAYWIIVDTGSTDATEEVARRALADVPGEYHHAAWSGFGKARTRALELAEGHGDYAWVVDADDVWTGKVSGLTKRAHSVWFEQPEARWTTVRFFRLGEGWRYEGSVHEEPVRDGPMEDRPLIQGVTIMSPCDGASWSDPEKYKTHAAMLQAELEKNPTNTRAAFYLAQSWREAGDDEKAAECYLARAAMGPGAYWEEVYVSYLEAGRALLRRGKITAGRDALLKAHETYPARREAMAELCRCFALLASVCPTVGTLFVQSIPGDEPEAAA